MVVYFHPTAPPVPKDQKGNTATSFKADGNDVSRLSPPALQLLQQSWHEKCSSGPWMSWFLHDASPVAVHHQQNIKTLQRKIYGFLQHTYWAHAKEPGAVMADRPDCKRTAAGSLLSVWGITVFCWFNVVMPESWLFIFAGKEERNLQKSMGDKSEMCTYSLTGDKSSSHCSSSHRSM